MDKKEKDRIAEAYIRLGTYKKVEIETGRSCATIWKVIKEYGIGKGIGGNQDTQRKITDAQLIEACKTMTLNEIAEKYGMHPYSLPRRFSRLGCKPLGYLDEITASDRAKILNEKIRKGEVSLSSGTFHSTYGECWHYVEGHAEIVKRNQPEFRYLESRTVQKKRIRLQCKICGEIIERANATVRYQKCECENCKSIKQAEKELLDERVKLMRFFNALIIQKTPKTCPICGDEFFSGNALKAYCSETCKRKAKRNRRKSRGYVKPYKKKRSSHYSSRCRKYGVRYESGITRIKVVERDGWICQICGKTCDENDKRWGSFGPDYPTVDHIKPLSLGGTHTWENVQCACGICNSKKRNLITA